MDRTIIYATEIWLLALSQNRTFQLFFDKLFFFVDFYKYKYSDKRSTYASMHR